MRKITWTPAAFLRAVDAEAKRRVRDAVVLGARVAKENMLHLDVPSPPWGYPRVDTGWLRQNITFEVADTTSGPVGRFGVLARFSGGKPLDYALYLEKGTRNMEPRPWLTLTINQCLPEWERIISSKGTVQRLRGFAEV